MRVPSFACLLVAMISILQTHQTSAQRDTKFWFNFNAGWSTLPDTELGGIQFTVNPHHMLYSIEFQFDESLNSTGVNTDVVAAHVGYVFNDYDSKVIFFSQLGPAYVKQYTIDCLMCERYNKKSSAGVAGEFGISYRPFVHVPFGLGARAIFNLNGAQSFTAFMFNFCVVRF